jgi:hypothetical protein
MTMLQKLLMVRRPRVVGLDAFEFHGFKYSRVALHLFFQKLDELGVAGHDLVQQLDLMFQMGNVGFNLFKPPGRFVCHGRDFASARMGSRDGELLGVVPRTNLRNTSCFKNAAQNSNSKARRHYYAFYDLNYYARNLGMFMMTSAVALFAERSCKNLYLGTCYSDNALYKTQFAGAEFFNGFRWSDDLEELKFIIQRDKKDLSRHLLETAELREKFYGGDLKKMTDASEFRVMVK